MQWSYFDGMDTAASTVEKYPSLAQNAASVKTSVQNRARIVIDHTQTGAGALSLFSILF